MSYKFFIQSLGCKVNQYDSAALSAGLRSLGFIWSAEEPDLVILNTCTVTKSAITKDRHALNLLRRKYPATKLIVMGCWPQTSDLALDSFDDKGIFWWGVGKRDEFLERIKEWFSITKINFPIFEGGLIASTERSRYFLKVGDGCNQFCSYCLIPYARGRLKSRPAEEIINEAATAIQAGYLEIVLCGIHLGLYGTDDKGGVDLVGLLKKMLALSPQVRFRLSSIEITEVSDELISLIKRSKGQICRHLHISLQSGSNKVLHSMRRPYTVEYFFGRVEKLRKILPDIALTTDIIVGFPGEGKEEFRETLDFVKKIGFAKIHVFSFSAHEKTLAWKMANQVRPAEIKDRSIILRDLSSRQERDYRKAMLTLHQKDSFFLIAERIKDGMISGHSEFFLEFSFSRSLAPLLRRGQGCLVAVKKLR